MTLSAIVPTLDEGARIDALAAWAVAARGAGTDLELIVSDGGSRDGTADRASGHGMHVVSGSPGRGQQLRRGAAAATGEVLLFLHADTALDPAAPGAIQRALGDAQIIGGNFRLLFDGDDDFSRWLDGFYARIRARGLYYGDSAIFVRRRVYDALGGIKPIALMEDFDFVRRLERHGRTVCIDDPPALTSSRRFAGRRKGRIIAQWLAMHALFLAGASPDLLARLYRSTTHSPAAL